jgi:hypothetical protein
MKFFLSKYSFLWIALVISFTVCWISLSADAQPQTSIEKKLATLEASL